MSDNNTFVIRRHTRKYIDIPEGMVDIMDPSYERSDWGTVRDLSILPGEYQRYFWEGQSNPDDRKRIWVLGICHEKYLRQYDMDKMEEIGTVGVDAGLMGIFPSPKKYVSDKEWQKFCNWMFEQDRIREFFVYRKLGGFISETGYGDGCYGVFAQKNSKGEIVALEVRF